MPAAVTPKASRRKAGTVKHRAAPAAQGSVLTDALAEAAWSGADTALAQALAELDAVEAAADAGARADALALLAQSLARAARKRGLSRIGVLGTSEIYDPHRHEFAGGRPPRTVRIEARGVARGGEVLVKARAGPLRRGKRP